ncbi:hypothetical protein [Glycomyces buryatensis]|uniref:Uncharacterized protein n=1 Tax=Glycomyces buryatensis TaxID=2570927 RepID=A0A4S8QGE1_9ACTN|nr:hypothetical protein [Glycomyces buryatensis]THV42025.1 hypothetical protein FAB82_08860 [Glycomyces buryatensis]
MDLIELLALAVAQDHGVGLVRFRLGRDDAAFVDLEQSVGRAVRVPVVHTDDVGEVDGDVLGTSDLHHPALAQFDPVGLDDHRSSSAALDHPRLAGAAAHRSPAFVVVARNLAANLTRSGVSGDRKRRNRTRPGDGRKRPGHPAEI